MGVIIYPCHISYGSTMMKVTREREKDLNLLPQHNIWNDMQTNEISLSYISVDELALCRKFLLISSVYHTV